MFYAVTCACLKDIHFDGNEFIIKEIKEKINGPYRLPEQQ